MRDDTRKLLTQVLDKEISRTEDAIGRADMDLLRNSDEMPEPEIDLFVRWQIRRKKYRNALMAAKKEIV